MLRNPWIEIDRLVDVDMELHLVSNARHAPKLEDSRISFTDLAAVVGKRGFQESDDALGCRLPVNVNHAFDVNSLDRRGPKLEKNEQGRYEACGRASEFAPAVLDMRHTPEKTEQGNGHCEGKKNRPYDTVHEKCRRAQNGAQDEDAEQLAWSQCHQRAGAAFGFKMVRSSARFVAIVGRGFDGPRQRILARRARRGLLRRAGRRI